MTKETLTSHFLGTFLKSAAMGLVTRHKKATAPACDPSIPVLESSNVPRSNPSTLADTALATFLTPEEHKLADARMADTPGALLNCLQKHGSGLALDELQLRMIPEPHPFSTIAHRTTVLNEFTKNARFSSEDECYSRPSMLPHN